MSLYNMFNKKQKGNHTHTKKKKISTNNHRSDLVLPEHRISQKVEFGTPANYGVAPLNLVVVIVI